MFVQCIMPDRSDRIRKSAITAMMNLMLILAIFNTKTLPDNLANHPKISVVFNNVSKHRDLKDAQQRIKTYKDLFLEEAYKFYCHKISDDTLVANKSWREIKSLDNLGLAWYKELSEFDKYMLESLNIA